MYRLSFKIDPCPTFPHGLSDTLDCDYATISAVEDDIAEIRTGKRSDVIDELANASMWVTDDKGNIY